MHIITQTQRLTIREFLPGELETYLDHLTNPQVSIYISQRSRAERAAIFNDAILKYADTRSEGIWGVFDANNEFVGSCLLRPYIGETEVLELGYSFEPQYWGQGIATEIVQAIAAYGLANNDIKAIIACTALPNMASQRVLLKTGFKQEVNSTVYGVELAFFRLPR